MTISASKLQFLADAVAELGARFDAFVSEDVAAKDAKLSSYQKAFKEAQEKKEREIRRKEDAALRQRRAPTSWGPGLPNADFGGLGGGSDHSDAYKRAEARRGAAS